jgi:hypothetical protein
MSNQKIDQNLPIILDDQTVAVMVANALREEHQNDTSSVKKIGQITGVSLHTINKWYRAVNAPNSANLLTLAQHYPAILKGLLVLLGRYDIWELCVVNNIPEIMSSRSQNSRSRQSVYEDKYVHINVFLKYNIAIKLNHRQLWFIGQLQLGKKLKANDISKLWLVSIKTANRDIAAILEHKIIKFNGARKSGFYALA